MIGWRPAVEARTISTLAAACHDHDCLRFRYRNHDGSEQARHVEPHQLVHTGSRWYLVAWDLLRDDWRTFRLDRVQPPIATASRFQPRPAPEGGFTAYVARSVSTAPYPHRARVILHASRAHMAEKIPPTAGTLEADGEDRCVFTTGTNSLDVLSVLLGITGVDFEVLEPPELIDHLRRLGLRIRRSVG
jgi:predicted DNA-binding transcriptional regulator YafY